MEMVGHYAEGMQAESHFLRDGFEVLQKRSCVRWVGEYAAALLAANRYEVDALAEVLVLREMDGFSGLEFHGV